MSISSKKPLYYQLKQTLLKWIEGGDYPPGSILPSEKQLQDSFGISRTTVRMALKELEQEGFLVRSPGKGTFVASMKIESGPRRILSFTQEMLNMGLQVSNQVVSLEKELPVIRTANKLQIPQDQPVWRLERIRMADSVPIATEVNYIPAALVPNMEARLAQNQSFYSCLEEEYGIIIVYARERVECRLARAGRWSCSPSSSSRCPTTQRSIHSTRSSARSNIVVCCGRSTHSTHSTHREFQTQNIRR